MLCHSRQQHETPACLQPTPQQPILTHISPTPLPSTSSPHHPDPHHPHTILTHTSPPCTMGEPSKGKAMEPGRRWQRVAVNPAQHVLGFLQLHTSTQPH